RTCRAGGTRGTPGPGSVTASTRMGWPRRTSSHRVSRRSRQWLRPSSRRREARCLVMPIDTPSLLHGEILHRRNRPVHNAFTYRSFCLALPLARIGELPRLGVAHNRPGIVSFFDSDHGPRDGTALEPWLRRLLAAEEVHADGEIVLYAFPRMLGYVFNPVSFWVCHDRAGSVRAVLCEVCNTFG